jgi:hypothetical protein
MQATRSWRSRAVLNGDDDEHGNNQDVAAEPDPPPFLKAFACGTFVHVCLLVFVGPGSTEVTGYFFGMAMLPALITGILARRSTTAWPLWQIVGTYILAFLVVVYLQVRR